MVGAIDEGLFLDSTLSNRMSGCDKILLYNLISFLQGLLDCDVRRKVRFGFKSKSLWQQKLKNAIYDLIPGELTECSEDLSRWIHIKRSHGRVGEEESSFGKVGVEEQDLLLLSRTADNGRKNWIYSALMVVSRVQCYKLEWRFIRRKSAVVMWVVKTPSLTWLEWGLGSARGKDQADQRCCTMLLRHEWKQGLGVGKQNVKMLNCILY